MTLAAWAGSPFTGLFTAFDTIAPEPHDPDLRMVAATLGRRANQQDALIVGGAGWSEDAARGACVGEAVERFETWRTADDGCVRSSHAEWPLDEPAVAPAEFALFTAQQHASEAFPFEPFTKDTATRWLSFRDLGDGSPVWVPEAFAVLYAAPGEGHGVAPLISTGLAAGRFGVHPVALRALQEVIERDALTRAWWGELRLEALDPDEVFERLGPEIRRRVVRPHLTYRFHRIATPYAAHATLVTTSGEEREGHVFSTGSAVRETRSASLEKALLEALQGRAYVRHQRARVHPSIGDRAPRDFAEHVLHYTLRPERLRDTVLARVDASEDRSDAQRFEDLPALLERSPGAALFRLMTPPSVSRVAPDAIVVKVVVPGLVPLHAHHHLAHLGAPFWRDRPLTEWLEHPPHPFA